MVLVLLPWLVLERTDDPGAAGLVAAATALPLLASSLFSGTIVDIVGRRRTAVVSDVCSALSAAAIPLVDLFLGLNLALLIALAIVGAVFDPAGVTARESMLPAAARRAGWPLHRVNGVHEANWGLAYLVGPGIAGLLIAWIGAVDTLWVAAVVFVVSAGFVAALRLPDAGRPADHHRPTGVWRGTKEGLAYVWHDRLLRPITLTSAALVSVYMPIEGVLLPVFFEARDEPGRLGVLIMALSAGGVIGALGYAALGARVRRSVAYRVALLVTSVVLLGMAVLPAYGLLLGLGFALGLAYGPVQALINYAMQIRSPERLRGRITGILTSTAYAAGPVGYLVAGYATDRWGVEPTFLAIAGAIVVVAVVGSLLRSIDGLDDGPDQLLHDAATSSLVP
jgi:MFS family permease